MPAAVEKMAYFGEVPWHGLGTRTDKAMTAQECLELGGLDFEVVKTPIFLPDGQGVPGYSAIVRTDRMKDNVMGVVGKDYTPVQNADAFRFFDSFVSRDEAMYHTAGSLRGGRRVWLLAKLPSDILVKGQDLVEEYLLLSNSHDGSSGVQIKLTNIRVVCQNTLTAALRGKGLAYSIRHTSGVQGAIDQAAKVMGLASKYNAELAEAFNRMADVQVKQDDIRQFLDRCFQASVSTEDKEASARARNQREAVEMLIEVGAGTELPGVRGTVWGLYNAVTEYSDHRKYGSADTRLDSAWFSGSGQTLKQTAFNEAMKLAGARECVIA